MELRLPGGRRSAGSRSAEETPLPLNYTNVMRDRALARIGERRVREDADVVFFDYMTVMLSAFLRRLGCELARDS